MDVKREGRGRGGDSGWSRHRPIRAGGGGLGEGIGGCWACDAAVAEPPVAATAVAGGRGLFSLWSPSPLAVASVKTRAGRGTSAGGGGAAGIPNRGPFPGFGL